MQVTTKAIVFSSIKYGDTSLIVKIFTQSDGLKSYLLKGILTSKKGKLKPALFQPLTQLEVVANHKNKGTLENIREAKVINHYQSLHSNIIKNSLVLFLAEMLSIVIQEEEENQGLFQYLEYAMFWLDTNDNSSNFHILFLLHLTKYLGFYPDTTNKDQPYFDLFEGCFLSSPSLNPILEGDSLEVFKKFLGINFDSILSINISNNQRQELLKKLLLYFELHLHGFRTPKSLAVLNAVFH